MLKIGIVSATFKNLPIDEVLSIAVRNNLKAIEWSENHHIELGNLKMAETVRKKTEDAGLVVASYGSYFRLGQDMDFIPSLENAKAIGTDKIRIWAGAKASEVVEEGEYEALVKEAKSVSSIAANEGIKVCLEWHKNTLTDRNESGLRFLEDVGSPYFRTFWQPSPEMDVPTRVSGIDMINPYLENIHVYYWDETGRRPLAEGKEEWEKYIEHFGTKDHYALLEFVKDNTVEQFESDAAAFSSWIK